MHSYLSTFENDYECLLLCSYCFFLVPIPTLILIPYSSNGLFSYVYLLCMKDIYLPRMLLGESNVYMYTYCMLLNILISKPLLGPTLYTSKWYLFCISDCSFTLFYIKHEKDSTCLWLFLCGQEFSWLYSQAQDVCLVRTAQLHLRLLCAPYSPVRLIYENWSKIGHSLKVRLIIR